MFPGWDAEVDNLLVRQTISAYEDLFGESPAVKSIHAGLECGVLGDRLPGLAMISFGPEIHGAHSPSERLFLASVPPFWRLLVRLLAGLST